MEITLNRSDTFGEENKTIRITGGGGGGGGGGFKGNSAYFLPLKMNNTTTL
jgi:hypothetical protein